MIKGMNWGIAAGGLGLLLSNFIKDPDKRKAVARGATQLLQIGASMKADKGGGGQDTGTGATDKPMPSNPPGQLPRPGVTDDSIKEAGKSTHTGPPKGANAELARKRLAIGAKKDPVGTPPTNNGMNTVNPNAPKLQINSKGMVDLRGTPAPGYEESKEYPGLYVIQDRKKPLW